ncbi:MAG: type II/IV secretion system protein, partial [Elusimicrobia bacterium]|nr:type II/IV secretion system protein [Elusimicrobiota bacterium]
FEPAPPAEPAPPPPPPPPPEPAPPLDLDAGAHAPLVPPLPPPPPPEPAPPLDLDGCAHPPLALTPAPEPAAPASPPPELTMPSPDADPAEVGDDELLEAVDTVREQQRLERERGIEADADDSPLVKRVHQLLVQGVSRRASDIHIEPQEDRVVVRFRVDGALTEACVLPPSIHSRLVTRIKIMANLVITEHRLPQDGQFRARIRGRKVEFRVSTLPSAYGEKIVLRALSSGGLTPDLARLGMEARDLDAVARTLASPHGLVLVTGPTGSGKTSTLYSMLAALNKPDVNILTAEDPIEYRLSGITQVQMNPAIGLKFETALRAFLRQDPDVMLVGEIRDLETAEIAVKASVTGHLVLSTLHTNGAPATIGRLAHIGVPRFLLAASLRLIVAQRLVRRLCASCRAPAQLTDDDRRALTEREQEQIRGALRAVGCDDCRRSGYAGRLPIFEVMPLHSAEMRDALQSQAGDRVAEVALREGMTTLRQAALRAVAAGETSLSDAYKVILCD